MNPDASSPSFSERLDTLEAVVRARSSVVPRVGIVLGSGLGFLAEELADGEWIDFADLPGWRSASAPGHAGRLGLGELAGQPAVVLNGRLHAYEGFSARQVVEPVLLMGRLGAREVVLTNAAGGINADFEAGTLMVIADHLNLTGLNPLIGPNDDRFGTRFPDLVDAWSPHLRALLHAAARTESVRLEEGVYAGLLGPNYETPAEVRMLQTLGADAVGMSTVLEAIAARWARMEVCGVAVVTNPGAGLSPVPLTHEDVLRQAGIAGERLGRVLRRFLGELDTPGA